MVWRALAYVEAVEPYGDEVVVSDEELRELVRAEEELRSAFYATVTRVG
nr:hypothetical protein [Nonomuraea aridisoli]